MFQNIKSIRVSDQIVSQIQVQIVEGQLAEGQKLPNEQDLAQQFGVSRASVREALSMLESKGVVERHKNGGTFLCKYCLEKILAAIDIPRKLDSELFEDLYEAREILEIRVAELACERADELDFMKIEKTLDMMQTSLEKGDSGIKADILFHQCIAMATKNQGHCRNRAVARHHAGGYARKNTGLSGQTGSVPERTPRYLPCHQKR